MPARRWIAPASTFRCASPWGLFEASRAFAQLAAYALGFVALGRRFDIGPASTQFLISSIGNDTHATVRIHKANGTSRISLTTDRE